MMWLADFRIAFASLRAARVRTFLTVFGIVIGVAAVTLVLALGEGARQAIGKQITQFGGEVVTIRPGKLAKDQTGAILSYDLLANFSASSLSEQDSKVVKNTPGVSSSAPVMSLRGPIASSEHGTESSQIIATSPDLPDVLSQSMKAGEFLNSNINRNTVVLGDTLANELLGSDQTIGQKISIRGEDYTVIGILNHSNLPLALNGLYDINRAAFVSVDAGKAMNQGIAQIQTINFRVADGSNVKTITKNVSQRLKEAHKIDDIAVIGSDEALKITDSLFAELTKYTAAIAGISLLVGGIGVMNIMLVAVTERTREIGIRKAVGATHAQVLRQFLVESVMMSVTGGVLGIVLAYLIALLVSFQLAFSPALTWEIVGWSLCVSVIVGIIFGIFPALRAAKKDPIEALRQLS
ncbi:MAG TPA: ABC transporter permease [Candidatus Saccharimonadales bacterium]